MEFQAPASPAHPPGSPQKAPSPLARRVVHFLTLNRDCRAVRWSYLYNTDCCQSSLTRLHQCRLAAISVPQQNRQIIPTQFPTSTHGSMPRFWKNRHPWTNNCRMTPFPASFQKRGISAFQHNTPTANHLQRLCGLLLDIERVVKNTKKSSHFSIGGELCGLFPEVEKSSKKSKRSSKKYTKSTAFPSAASKPNSHQVRDG
jgi:hypothetical protein